VSISARADGLDQAQRERLAALADVLIPGGSGLPSASEADVSGQWIDRTLNANGDLTESVMTMVATTGDPDLELARLRAEQPAVYERFVFAVSAAYVMNSRVRRSLGYPGVSPGRSPAPADEAEFYLEGDVLGPVIRRGPIFRPTPG
jgi:hypothetical protein